MAGVPYDLICQLAPSPREFKQPLPVQIVQGLASHLLAFIRLGAIFFCLSHRQTNSLGSQSEINGRAGKRR
jgi:hypothetical protein